MGSLSHGVDFLTIGITQANTPKGQFIADISTAVSAQIKVALVPNSD